MNALALKMQRRAEAIKHEAQRTLAARKMAATGPEQDLYIEWLLARYPKKAEPAKEKASTEGDEFVTVKAIAYAGAKSADQYAPFKEALRAGKTVEYVNARGKVDISSSRWNDFAFEMPPACYRIKE